MSSKIQKEKTIQACEILRELDMDMWLVWVRETSQMADPVLDLVLGGDLVWQSALIFTKDGPKEAIVGNFDSDGIEAKGIFNSITPYVKGIADPLRESLKNHDPSSIGVNYSVNDVAADGLTYGMYQILKDYLKDTKYTDRLVSAEEVVTKLRGRKTPSEIGYIQRAVDITEEIFQKIESELRVGMSELSIYRLMHEMMETYGVGNAWHADHNPAVDAGPNKQFGHAGPTENKTKAGHLLHFDFGVKFNGYCSDIQRMFFFGPENEVPSEVQDAFEAVKGAIQAAAKFIAPGKKGYEVDAIARDYVKERGYEEYQHALGHQVGRHAHDGGGLLGPLWERYGNTPKIAVEESNVFTLELYVTTENYGQVSLEEDIVVTKTGCKFLSKPQEALICISNT